LNAPSVRPRHHPHHPFRRNIAMATQLQSYLDLSDPAFSVDFAWVRDLKREYCITGEIVPNNSRQSAFLLSPILKPDCDSGSGRKRAVQRSLGGSRPILSWNFCEKQPRNPRETTHLCMKSSERRGQCRLSGGGGSLLRTCLRREFPVTGKITGNLMKFLTAFTLGLR